VSTNLPLWWLEEEKRLLVIASLCGILNGDVASFVGVNFGLNPCVSFACLNSLSLSNPRTCFSPIYNLVVFQLISLVAGDS
jgi:hypothetical protein